MLTTGGSEEFFASVGKTVTEEVKKKWQQRTLQQSIQQQLLK